MSSAEAMNFEPHPGHVCRRERAGAGRRRAGVEWARKRENSKPTHEKDVKAESSAKKAVSDVVGSFSRRQRRFSAWREAIRGAFRT